MLKRTLHFLQKKTPWQAENNLLLAVSGGVDSMVMAHLFKEAREQGLVQGQLALAHCHFGLRREADLDAELVQQTAEKWGLPCFTKSFETAAYAEHHQMSIQMAARELRYLWFGQLLEEQGFDFLLTAHHLNDSLETALLNFIRGSGLKGLIGIPARRGHILRPLLETTREEILAYAKKHHIPWREDSSNQSLKYRRNLLRHEIIPRLQQINPGLLEGFRQTSHNLKEAEKLYRHALAAYGLPPAEGRPPQGASPLLQAKGKNWEIDKKRLLETPAPATILYELLRPFGFSAAVSRQALEGARGIPGSIFLSPTHEMLSDRDKWVIRSRTEVERPLYIEIQRGQASAELPDGRRLLMKWDLQAPQSFPDTPCEAWLDADKPEYPLLLRPWKAGDFIRPLGMKGRKKKLQDLFTDHKLSRFEKEKIPVLADALGRIAWVPGLQMAEWCKVDEESERVVWFGFEEK